MTEQQQPVKEQEEPSDAPVFFRTALRKDVHQRLVEFAKRYETGFKKFDYGVAIQILLDFFEQSEQAIQSQKVDYIIQLLESQHMTEQEPDKKEEQPDKYITMLGGTKIKVSNK